MISDKNILILGAGRSGIGAAHLCLAHHANVTILDSNRELDTGAVLGKFKEEQRPRVKIALGDLTDELTGWADLAILSPGIPIDHEWVLTCVTPSIGDIKPFKT